jgi:hypothetical protein
MTIQMECKKIFSIFWSKRSMVFVLMPQSWSKKTNHGMATRKKRVTVSDYSVSLMCRPVHGIVVPAQLTK